MNEFLLWFIRPIAEFLGFIALMVGLCVAFLGYVSFEDWREKRRKRKEAHDQTHADSVSAWAASLAVGGEVPQMAGRPR